MYTVAQAIGNPELTANKGMAIDTAVQASFKAVGPLFRHLFMGEEYGEWATFHYSIDHGDEALIEAGRRTDRLAEFIPSGWKNISDPYAMDTFESSRLTSADKRDEGQQHLVAWTRQLIALRKQHASLGVGTKGHQLRNTKMVADPFLVSRLTPRGGGCLPDSTAVSSAAPTQLYPIN